MTIHYPLTTHATAAPRRDGTGGGAPLVPNLGSWRYDSRRTSRTLLVSAMLVSAGAHLVLLFGVGRGEPKPVAAPQEEAVIALVALPQVKELEEPEPLPSDDAGPPVDIGELVPMQQDVPSMPQPSDFVQEFNFASLIEPPDFSKAKVFAIPEHIRSAGNLAGRIGKIFNIEDLDRIPEATLQPAPTYPPQLRREGITATVLVEFVVDTEGRVVNPTVIESSHHGFDDAACFGVSRWKFRAGVRGGRRVNTRMRVPIVFRTIEEI